MKKEKHKIAIVGFGYIGLNIGLFACKKGSYVIGIDNNKDIVNNFNKFKSLIKEQGIEKTIRENISLGRIKASNDISLIQDMKIIIVTVGSPLNEDFSPNMEFIEQVSKSLGKYLKKGHVVIYKSTLVPGTTENVIKPILELESGLVAGKDFALAFCPERLAEGGSMNNFQGSALLDMENIPVIVGGINSWSTEIVSDFWKSLGLEIIQVSGPGEAEMAKLADNLWIDLNIALANEIALVSEKIGVDALEIIKAANTLPKGQHMVNILYPGSGVGGYCLTKDPWFFYHLGKKNGLELETPKASRKINDSMPEHIYKLVMSNLKNLDKELKNSKVAVLGLSFKNCTGDLRNTHVKKLIDLLKKEEINLSIYDPWVDKKEAEKLFSIMIPDNIDLCLKDTDCIVVATGHPEFRNLDFKKIKSLVSSKCLIIDGRSCLNSKKILETGLDFQRIGLGRKVLS